MEYRACVIQMQGLPSAANRAAAGKACLDFGWRKDLTSLPSTLLIPSGEGPAHVKLLVMIGNYTTDDANISNSAYGLVDLVGKCLPHDSARVTTPGTSCSAPLLQ